MRKKRHFAASGGKDKDSVAASEEQGSIDKLFISLVKARDYDRARPLIVLVTDINVRDPELGATALHFAAARSASAFLSELEKRQDLDYGARDNQGYRPSDAAWVIGQNEALSVELMKKEHAQAQRRALEAGGPEASNS